MKTEKPLLQFNKPNKNGRTYLYHEVNLPKTVPCYLQHPVDNYVIYDENDPNIGAIVNLKMNAQGIFLDNLDVFDDERGRKFEEMMMDGSKIICNGTGCVDENGCVSDYRLLFVYLK